MDYIHPFAIVAGTTSTYTALIASTQCLSRPSSDLRANLRLISSVHATLTTGLALYALSRPWPVEHPLPPLNLGLGTSRFDDSANPLIAGQSALGNAVTGMEAGYLLFDTVALVYSSIPPGRLDKAAMRKAASRLLQRDSLMLFHHLSLFAGLGTLQHFILHGRERGIYIIVAFILMNASTPLLHLRWYLHKRTGRPSLAMDAALAVVFGACRVGVVGWVLREYGKFHGVGVWEAFRGQRWICQLGTGALVGVNAAWLGALCKGIVRRMLGGGNSSSQRSR